MGLVEKFMARITKAETPEMLGEVLEDLDKARGLSDFEIRAIQDSIERRKEEMEGLDQVIDAEGAEIAAELREEASERTALEERASGSLATIPQGMELTEKQVDATVRHFALFERVKKEVLDPRVDVLYIGSKGAPLAYESRKGASSVYIRKSGWRKLAMVFSINLKVVDMDREDHEDADGKYYLWNARVHAEHPSGKYAEGIGVATSRDQFFTRKGSRLADEKDIKLKAQTVGENRAISNLIGGGQMTAEEV